MSNLSKLTLTTTTPNQPMTALARKRVKLIRKLDQQLLAAEAAGEGLEATEEVKRWVDNAETGKREQVAFNRPVKKWWWANQHGALMITLKDGNRDCSIFCVRLDLYTQFFIQPIFEIYSEL
jgi:hypothetical protein